MAVITPAGSGTALPCSLLHRTQPFDRSNIRTANEFAGSQVGSQPQQTCGDARRRPATVAPGQCPSARCPATRGDGPGPLRIEGAPTLALDRLWPRSAAPTAPHDESAQRPGLASQRTFSAPASAPATVNQDLNVPLSWWSGAGSNRRPSAFQAHPLRRCRWLGEA
jgi:hypothetical protein